MSLPTSHPSFAPQKHLDFSGRWKAPPIPNKPAELFIGILSAGNHFLERMAMRKSWMQHELIKSSKVVVRFFVALHARKDLHAEVKKEAEFFGDFCCIFWVFITETNSTHNSNSGPGSNRKIGNFSLNLNFCQSVLHNDVHLKF